MCDNAKCFIKPQRVSGKSESVQSHSLSHCYADKEAITLQYTLSTTQVVLALKKALAAQVEICKYSKGKGLEGEHIYT